MPALARELWRMVAPGGVLAVSTSRARSARKSRLVWARNGYGSIDGGSAERDRSRISVASAQTIIINRPLPANLDETPA